MGQPGLVNILYIFCTSGMYSLTYSTKSMSHSTSPSLGGIDHVTKSCTVIGE